MYQVRRMKIGKTDQLDELARECGRLYSQTLTSFWRTVRHKGIWLKPKHLMRWYTSEKLHAHTADACVQAFFASLKSWRERRKSDPTAKPPRKHKWYFRVEYKSTAMRHKDGVLTLSNGKGNAPLILPWPWETPKTVVIHWTGTTYEVIATYAVEAQVQPQGDKVAGIDLGEIHMAVSHDGEQTHILNGRLLRSKRQYQNKLKAKLSSMIDVKKKGSRRRKKLIHSKKKQLKKLKNQIKDIEHKQTSKIISILHENGVQMLVIGDKSGPRSRSPLLTPCCTRCRYAHKEAFEHSLSLLYCITWMEGRCLPCESTQSTTRALHSWQSKQALPLHPTFPPITPTLLRARSAGDAALDTGD